MLKSLLKRVPERFGYELRRARPLDMDADFWPIQKHAASLGGPSVERNFALHNAVRYIAASGIPGDFVECGVHRGASCAVMALTLKALGVSDRRIYMYDTYAGMAEPTEKDVDVHNTPARVEWQASQQGDHNQWAYCPLPQVQANMRATGYPFDRFVFVQGKVEDTIPATLPQQIAILRLDTDWYESTWHEMVHLFPRLVNRGVLLIDDYGAWKGAREAVDKYLAEQRVPMLLNRVDSTGRIGVKS